MNSKKANWKSKVEDGFEQMGLIVGNHPWRWLLGCLLIIGMLASQLGHLKQDSSIWATGSNEDGRFGGGHRISKKS